jgi:hypothetical protein
MATNSTLPLLPNPFTPFAFLPPNIALQYQLANYVTVATLSVSGQFSRFVASKFRFDQLLFAQAFIWDWLMSIPEEIAIVRKRRFRLPTVAYFMSR